MQNKKLHKTALIRSSFLAGIFVPSLAYAQSTSAGPADSESNDIIVTAQRRAERLQDVPVSVGVFAAETLEKQNLTSLEGVSNRASSVLIRPSASSDQVAIRGTNSGGNAGFEQSVATFVDGVYRPRARSVRVALFDVERVEFLKGPQTTYFGANAIAGAINITTRKPGKELAGNMVAFYSPDENEYNLELGVDLPASENLAFRVAGRLNGMDAIARNTRIDKRGKLETGQLRVSTVANLSDTVTIEGRFDYARVRNTGTLAFETTNCPPAVFDLPAAGQCARALSAFGTIDDKRDRKFQTGFLDVGNVDLYEGVVSATIELGGADLVSTTAYQDQNVRLIYENIAIPAPSPLGVNSLMVSDYGDKYKQFSQEIRLQSTGDGKLRYMVGAYYEHGTTTVPLYLGYFQGQYGALAPDYFNATDLIVAASDASQKSTTWSGFATLSYEFTPQLRASVGMRYSSVRKTASRNGFIGTVAPWADDAVPHFWGNVVPGPLAGQAQLSPLLGASISQFPIRKRTDDEWMPSANITYKITDDVMTYASYTHGFKAGGYNLLLSTDIFDPETADSYEFGLKSSWLNRRLTANITFFQTDYKNLQESGNLFLESGTFVPFIGNVAKSRSKGVEFEMNALLADGFSINANVAYLEAKYLDYPNAPCSPIQNILSKRPNAEITCPRANAKGEYRGNAPKWSGSVSAEYSHEISSDMKLSLGSTMYFRSKYYLSAIPEDVTAQMGFAKVDARAALGKSDGVWEVSVIGQNILNKKTYTYAAHAPSSPGSTQFATDRGRSIGVQFKMKFN